MKIPWEKDDCENWKLLEERTFNDRTLVAWYNPNGNIISFIITHLYEQPNELAKLSEYTNWGYITHFETGIYSYEEAAEVISLYLQDIENENAWWETERWQKK